MKRVLLDTNAYAALFRGAREVEEALNEAETVLMSAVVLGELHAGFRGGARRAQNVSELADFLDDPAVEVQPVADETAEVFGRLKHELKKSGAPLPINDVWIAAQCIETGAVLATYDTHFRKVPGLRLWDVIA